MLNTTPSLSTDKGIPHHDYYANILDFFCLSRLLREIRDRYLHSGSPLELPAETRNWLRVNKASRLTLAQLKELQTFMVQGLREYWWVNDKSLTSTTIYPYT